MSWLGRLKAHVADAREQVGHRQNRQNPGFVSFDSAEVARISPPRCAADMPSGGGDAAREAFEERAAIMEYDGGMMRADAERLATELRASAANVATPSRFDLESWGDLRPCTVCRNLTRSGRCLAAWRGDIVAARDWGPTVPGQPQRCIAYAPTADDPDQTPGRERWPWLAEWQVPLRPGASRLPS